MSDQQPVRWITTREGRRVPIELPGGRRTGTGGARDTVRSFLSRLPRACWEGATVSVVSRTQANAAGYGACGGWYDSDADAINVVATDRNAVGPLTPVAGLFATLAHEATHRLVEMSVRAGAVAQALGREDDPAAEYESAHGGLLYSDGFMALLRRLGDEGWRNPHAFSMALWEEGAGQEVDAEDLREMGAHVPAGRNEWLAMLYEAFALWSGMVPRLTRRVGPREACLLAGIAPPNDATDDQIVDVLQQAALIVQEASEAVEPWLADISGPLEVSESAAAASQGRGEAAGEGGAE